MPAIDPNSLPNDVDLLQKIVVDLCEQLQHESSEKNKYRSLLRELLEAQRNRKSEQLSKEQLALFETLWKAQRSGSGRGRRRLPSRKLSRSKTPGRTAAGQEAQRAAASGRDI